MGLNCEDVMLWLVFRHLIPMNYLLPSQRETLHMMPDIHGRGAQKLLSLVPICCTGMVFANPLLTKTTDPQNQNVKKSYKCLLVICIIYLLADITQRPHQTPMVITRPLQLSAPPPCKSHKMKRTGMEDKPQQM